MTKEMSFIPLSHEQKLNGKAAIDGVGSRLGKSGGSVIYQGLLIIFSSLTACTPVLGVIVIGIIIFWIAAVRALGVRFNEAITRHETEMKEVPEPVKEAVVQTI
jgi:AAA family ATP:ADP antiporter